jgi:hypothetical protein
MAGFLGLVVVIMGLPALAIEHEMGWPYSSTIDASRILEMGCSGNSSSLYSTKPKVLDLCILPKGRC